MSQVREFDVVVVGAGPAGEVCAGRLAGHGASVAIVERELVGGECSYYACIPSKSLLRPEQALAEARRVPGAAEAARGQLDVAAVLRRRDEAIDGLDDTGHLPWLKERSIELVRGEARLRGVRELSVGETLLRARSAVVLATGSDPTLPQIAGLREAAAWTNRQATTSPEVPASLLVLGGGVVGAELACAYASLGSRVTIVEAAPRLLAEEEPFASELLAGSLAGRGVELLLGARTAAVRRTDGSVTLELEDGRAPSGMQLLVATGRTPRTRGLGGEQFGIREGEPIEVDDTLRVPGHDWLYAVGDVNGRALLTHIGKYQGRLAADHIVGRPVELRSDGRLVPRVIFTEPQIAAVGHTLASARQAGLTASAVDVGVEDNAGGSFVGRGAPGTARLVVDDERRVLLGATFAGVDVAESLHAASIAVIGELSLDRLWHAVPCFPTRSEVWLKLLEAYGL